MDRKSYAPRVFRGVVSVGLGTLGLVLLLQWQWRIAQDRNLSELLARMEAEPFATEVEHSDAAGETRRMLASMGDDAIGSLVRALGSSRVEVARGARWVLHDQMTSWQSLAAPAAGRNFLRLAAQLADEVGRYDSTARRAAAELAMLILLRANLSSNEDRLRLYACCDQVLQTAGATPTDSDLGTVAAASRRREKVDHRAWTSDLETPNVDDLDLDESRALRSKRTIDQPTKIPPASLANLEDVGLAEPRRLIAGLTARKLPSSGEVAPPLDQDEAQGSETAMDDPRPGSKDNIAGLDANVGGTSPSRVILASSLSGADTTSREDPRSPDEHDVLALETLPAPRLFSLLRASDPDLLRAAEAELVARGFSRRERELAEHLTSAKASERRVWTGLLPRVRGVDAKPWLLWLSDDSDAEVRLAALTLMATSRDRELLSRVELAATQDASQRVRSQAERMVERMVERQRAGRKD